MKQETPNTFTYGTKKEGITKWPSGDHVADWQIHDGPIVVSLSMALMSVADLDGLISHATHELADVKTGIDWRLRHGCLLISIDFSGLTNEGIEAMISAARAEVARRKPEGVRPTEAAEFSQEFVDAMLKDP